jgi:3-hydroxy-3-methylglutaryl CoA synthase
MFFTGSCLKPKSNVSSLQFYNDFLLNKSNLAYKDVQHLAEVPTEKSYDNREIEETFVKMSKNAYNTKVIPSTVVPTQIGNTYTASLYFGFASLLATVGSAGLVSLIFMHRNSRGATVGVPFFRDD